ncbi:MAG: tRNA (adenosine(37)-N6)-threonylcarbamoyltransferase complex ATPase subunit type 1 TsaE [Clostridiales bacterium]|jgi:tRNA threonylcarbamoyladenosine biosynthesis protein TsaE|nr:tRNA (adenosine(37)-N6)-threonylcarbamoyltransferase complex ATPase subunit type 1 TsaE [Clostridiales bacterium]
METSLTFTSESPEDTEQIGERLSGQLQSGEVVALFGGMGMGKTAFVRGLARGLGCKDPVSSPTFALVHQYSGRCLLYHFDMYRVTGWDDLYSTGFFDYLDAGAVLVVEWSENIEAALPEDAVRVTISPGVHDNQRIIEVEGKKAL